MAATAELPLDSHPKPLQPRGWFFVAPMSLRRPLPSTFIGLFVVTTLTLAAADGGVLFSEALKLQLAGKLEAAIVAYDCVIAAAPDHAEAINNRGMCRWFTGNHAGAAADLERAVVLRPSDALTLANRGCFRMEAGDTSGAAEDFAQALRAEPENERALLGRSSIKLRSGDTAGAIADCDHLLVRNPDNLPALVVRASARLLQSEPDAALHDLNKAIANTESSLKTTDLGAVSCQTLPTDGGVSLLVRPHAAEAQFAEAYFMRGQIHRNRDAVWKAEEDFTRALELRPAHAHALGRRAEARLFLDKNDAALADATAALELDPKLAAARYVRGCARFFAGEFEGAESDLTATIDADPVPTVAAVALGLRGVSRRALGKAAEAEVDLDRAIALGGVTGPVIGARAILRLERSDYEGAEADLTRLLGTDAARANHWCDRGIIRWTRGDRAGAADDFARGAKLADVRQHLWRYAVLVVDGKPGQATSGLVLALEEARMRSQSPWVIALGEYMLGSGTWGALARRLDAVPTSDMQLAARGETALFVALTKMHSGDPAEARRIFSDLERALPSADPRHHLVRKLLREIEAAVDVTP